MDMILNLQLFADAGNLVNATGTYVNAYSGATTAFDTTNTLSATMKTYYDTELLENAREKLVYQQLGRVQNLPANHGKVVEWRKWNTLPDVAVLTEGVIPTGQKLGILPITVELAQYGEYVTISDLLDLHSIDDAVLGATEELGAAAGKTYDKLIRNVLSAYTSNVIYAENADGTQSNSRAELLTNNAMLTPKMVNKAVTKLQKANAPTFSGNKFVGVIHPSVAFDLRQSSEWIEAHKYAAPEEMFNGEIGELHGVRFIQSTLAPVITQGSSVIYQTMIFGKDAFGVVDPEGAGMETIIKNRNEVGGPLNQFSTVGCKFEMGCKVLYGDRYVTIESASAYSATDSAN